MKPDQHKKAQIFTRRAVIILMTKLVVFTVLLGRLMYLQVFQYRHWRDKAEHNRVKMGVTPGLRGCILDRNEKVIASNDQRFRLIIDIDKHNPLEKTLKELGTLLDWQEHTRLQASNKVAKLNRFQVMLQQELSWKELATIKEAQYRFPQVQVASTMQRYYPKATAISHLVGYIGWPSNDTHYAKVLLNHHDFKIGKYGIERKFENQLQGQPSYQYFEVDAKGQKIRDLKKLEGQTGKDLVLSIDADLQYQAEKLFASRGGAAIVSDLKTGEVLCAYSGPGLDINLLSAGNQEYWATINQDASVPLINRLSRGLYSPGSAFKLVTAMAALEAGIDPERHRACHGSVRLGDTDFQCHARLGHGAVNLVQALTVSCNVYFWEVAKQIGYERIRKIAHAFGFGNPVGWFDDEKSGLVPTNEWKIKHHQHSWGTGDTFNTCIGQGYLLATPLQMWRMVSIIAGRGKAMSPEILRYDDATSRPSTIHAPIVFPDKYYDYLHKGMSGVFSSPMGTAHRHRLPGDSWQLAGKTGTVQLLTYHGTNMRNGPNHAIFVGYAPAHDPRYSCAVVVERGGSGSGAAAPIARELLVALKPLHI